MARCALKNSIRGAKPAFSRRSRLVLQQTLRIAVIVVQIGVSADDADKCRAVAQSATDGYYDEWSWRDDMALGAAELYRATGSTSYLSAAKNYITAAGFPDDPDRFARVWPADLHVIGKDITKFHAIIWPAMMMSAGIEPPRKLAVHGFVYVRKGNERFKMSKSLGTVIDPDMANQIRVCPYWKTSNEEIIPINAPMMIMVRKTGRAPSCCRA